MAPSSITPALPPQTLGTVGVATAAVALVVSGSTLVTDFTGFANLGVGFTVSLLIGLLIVLPVVVSATDLTISNPRAGGIYQFARSVIRGRAGKSTGLFLAMLFVGTFFIGVTGETISGAQALRSLSRSEAPVSLFAAALIAAALVPNLLGLRRATWITGFLLVAMLGIRWFFGLAGFFGWSDAGAWSAGNLMPTGGLNWGGSSGMFAQGIALGFWCFVGIEGACGLAEETKRPERSIPRGLLLALLAILATTLVMGLGVMGSVPQAQWSAITGGANTAGGQAPHLAVGQLMFGTVGRDLMACASVASTLSTLLIAMAAVPRMIFALARDRVFPGAVSRLLARTHARTGTPVASTLAVAAIQLTVALFCDGVLDWLCVAAYLWFVRHLVIHVLAIANRIATHRRGAFSRATLLAIAGCGTCATLTAFQLGFADSHTHFAPRALVVAAVALAITAASLLTRRAAASESLGRVSYHIPSALSPWRGSAGSPTSPRAG